MAEIKTFAAVRPKSGLTERIAALPYDVYSREEAREEVKREPLSFLCIDRGETMLPAGGDIYAPEVYEKAEANYQGMVQAGNFVKDKEAGYYLYELTMNGRIQTGLAACASVDDYLNGVIKKHENTRADKEADRTRHVDALNAQTGPIFLAYRKERKLEEIFLRVKKGEPIFDFTREGGIRHRGFRIVEPRLLETITEIFKNIPNAYIADGHHRAASAVRAALKRRAEMPDYTGEEEFNYVLSVFFPDEELKILDYNRVVKTLGGFSEEEFLTRLEEMFAVQRGAFSRAPQGQGEFGLYLPNRCFRLTTKEEIKRTDPVEGLDAALLQREVFDRLLGIKDPRTDKRIDFVGGIRGLHELEMRVSTDCRAAFSLYPTSMKELFSVADKGTLMPPKSTWFEPKLLSGLFVHEI